MNIISLSELKTFIGVLGDEDNDRLTLLGEQAEAQTTTYLGWEVWSSEREFKVNVNCPSKYIAIPALHLTAIDRLTLDDVDVDYDQFYGHGLIVLNSYFRTGLYTITATTGYDDIPADIRHAVCLLASNRYHQNQALASESLGDRSQTYDSGLPSQIKQLLTPHRVMI